MGINALHDSHRSFHVGIVGLGAVASALAYCLQRVGLKLSFISRAGIDRTTQLKLRVKDMNFTMDPLGSGELDLVFICVKAYQVKQALLDHAAIISQDSVGAIICLSNGIYEHELDDLDPSISAKLRLGMTTLAVSSRNQSAFTLVNPESANVVWYSKQLCEVESFLCQSGSYFVLDKNIDFLRHRKWLFNSSLNTLCFLQDLSENRLALNYKNELFDLFKDLYELGLELWGPWDESLKTMFDNLCLLIEKTGANMNSMQADKLQRRKTELEYFTGLYKLANKPYPKLEAVSDQVRLVDNGRDF